MNSLPRDELLRLLGALCDDRIEEDDAARLEKAVGSDAEARRLYLDYVTLHGLLYWDAVQGAGVSGELAVTSFADPPATIIEPPVERPTRWSLATVVSLATAASVLALVALFLLRGDRGDQVVVDRGVPQDPAANDANVSHQGSESDASLTPVRLPSNNVEKQVPPANVAEVVPPEPKRTGDIVAFIDQQLASSWKDVEVEPSATADDAEWLRRVCLDITGRIPEVAQVEAFLADPSPNKRAAMVDQLLNDPMFAGHMATVWTNLLVGRVPERDIDRDALARFLREQFWKNRPWIETVTELVAAEGSEHENGAANFLLAHLNNQAVPATAITARIFLCEQVQCSQCHLHPQVKEWGQEQFWELNAFFSQTELMERREPGPDGQSRMTRELVTKSDGGPTYFETLGGVMRVAYPKFNGQDVSTEDGVNRRRELARLMSEGDRPQMALAFVNRMWSQFFGKGFTSPVDDMGPHNPPTHPEILNALSEEFVASGYDVRQLVKWMCSTKLYQLSSRTNESNAQDTAQPGQPPLFSRMYLKPLTAEQVFDSLIASTSADKAGIQTWSEASDRRKSWLSQFYSALDNEENSETTTFDGTLPQALVMMNGELVREATSSRPGTSLHALLSANGGENEKLRQLCLSSLSREPSELELAAFRGAIRQGVRVRGERRPEVVNEALADAYWAYLNSAEFLVNH